MLVINEQMHLVFTHGFTCSAMGTSGGIVRKLRYKAYALWIMAPVTMQIATLEKYHAAYSRPVIACATFNIENQSGRFISSIHCLCFCRLCRRQKEPLCYIRCFHFGEASDRAYNRSIFGTAE